MKLSKQNKCIIELRKYRKIFLFFIDTRRSESVGTKETTETVTLKDQKGNTSLRSRADLSVTEKIGGEFEPLSERFKVDYGLNSGVIAKNIVNGSELSKIGVVDNYIIMEINGKPVNSQKDIENILKNYKGTVSVKYLDEYGRITSRGFTMP